jgi:hypothetical protein
MATAQRQGRRRQETPQQRAQREEIIRRVKAAVQRVFPDAQLILYGSRARGDWRDDSDWDFLALTDAEVTAAGQDAVWDAVFDVEWETGDTIAVTVCNAHTWQTPRIAGSPWHAGVLRDGIAVAP